MPLPWPHRDGEADEAPPPAAAPSPESAQRLADRLHREVEDLRDELTDDLLLALLLLGEDEGDEAVGLLDSGSDRLQRFQDRVEDAVAEAAVEREAEQVIAAASTASAGAGRVSGTRGAARRVRVLASVAAAALATIVALVSVEPSGDHALVAARASSQPAETGPSVPGLPDGSSSGGPGAPTDVAGAEESAVTPDGRLEALRAIDDEDDVLAKLGNEPRRSVVAALFGVDRLAGDVVAGADDVLSSEPVDAVTESASEAELPVDRSSSEPEPTNGESPSEEPATDPASDGPTAEESGGEPSDGTSGSDGASDDGTSDEGDPDDGSSDDPSEDDDADDSSGSFPGTDRSAPATTTDGSGVL